MMPWTKYGVPMRRWLRWHEGTITVLVFLAILALSMWVTRARAVTLERATPTMEQIAACKDDAIRYCWAAITEPGGEAVRACMILHKRKLSQQCKDAFAK